MRTVLIMVSLLLIAISAADAVENQSYLGMFAETSLTKIAGMPEMPPIPPGIDVSTMPGMEGMMSMGKPTRSFKVRLWSPGIAPDDAAASVAPPVSLKQGEKLDLELYRPKPEKTNGQEGSPGSSGEKPPDFTIKYYWGSSATVRTGQPKVINFKTMDAEARRLMEKESRSANARSAYYYKSDWTTGYWPTRKQPGKIAEDASLPGKYSLTTSYTGSVEIECPANVDFLAPIEIVAPNLEESPDLSAALRLEWKPIPNLLGSQAIMMGMQGQDTIIMWSSSEVWRDNLMSVDWGYLQMAEVKQYVKDKIMMPAEQTGVTIPAGIFSDCDFTSMTMTGYGPGAARMDSQPLPRIQTKTTLSLQLGGKAVGEMGGN